MSRSESNRPEHSDDNETANLPLPQGSRALSETASVPDRPLKLVGDGVSVDGDADQDMPERKRFRISLRVSFVLIMLFVCLSSSAAIYVPWFFTATSNVKELVHQLNGEIIADISNEVNDVLMTAVSVEKSLSEIFQTGAVDPADYDQVLRLYRPFIKNQSHFSWLSLGLPDGNFLGVNRLSADKYRAVTSIWNEDKQLAERQFDVFMVEDGQNFELQTEFEQQKYDARERPWYVQAMAARDGAQTAIWTDVYVFASSGTPGLNTALRVERDGEALGVISVAIELERLSSYLAQKFRDKPGAAVILQPDTSLIAFVDSAEVKSLTMSGGGLNLRKLDESYHPLLQMASKALKDNSVSLLGLNDIVQLDVSDELNQNYFVTFAPAGHRNWVVATVIPEEAFLVAIKENNKILMVTIFITVCLVILFAIVLSRRLIVKPIASLITHTKAIERFSLGDVQKVDSYITELDDLSSSFSQMARGLSAFQKYLPAELVQILFRNNQLAQVGGINRTMTIFFSDLENFTTISEVLGPRLVPYLSDYMNDMSNEIHKENGIIDKFIGDAIMAFWGAPIVNDNQAVDACRAALRCTHLLASQEDQAKKEGRPAFRARIGLNTGRVIVGNIGSDTRVDYTVLGDPVNLAARLEALNKVYGTSILIGATTFEFCKYDMIIRKIDSVNVKGKDQKTPIYELLAERPGPGMSVPGFEWIAIYEAGLDLMDAQRYEEAIARFEDTKAARDGVDSPSDVMIARCRSKIAEKTT